MQHLSQSSTSKYKAKHTKSLVFLTLFSLVCVPLLAQTAKELQKQIMQIEIQILQLEDDPNEQDTIVLLKQKQALLQQKLNTIYAPNIQPSQTPQNIQTQPNAQQPIQPSQIPQQPQQHPTQKIKHKTATSNEKESDTKDRSGVLLGFSIGGMQTKVAELGLLGNEVTSSFAPIGFRFGIQGFGNGLKSDYKKWWPLGSRIYVDYYFMPASSKDESVRSFQQMWSINADLLLEFNIPQTYAYFGVFAGIGWGQIYCTHQVRGLFSTTEAIIQGNSLFANLGAALTLGAKHRLEFYYKMPNSSTHTGNYLTRSISDMAAFAYQYTF